MHILAVDTSSERGSVCATADQEVLGEVRLASSVQYSERLFRSVEFLFRYLPFELSDVDLFVAEMPVGDVLGFLEKGEFGRSAWDDFGFTHNAAGDLRRTPEELEILKKWAPTAKAFELRNPLLIVTAANDDRVEPSQSYEMAMALHRRDSDLVFLRTEPGGGHEAVTAADVLTFMAEKLRIDMPDPL